MNLQRRYPYHHRFIFLIVLLIWKRRALKCFYNLLPIKYSERSIKLVFSRNHMCLSYMIYRTGSHKELVKSRSGRPHSPLYLKYKRHSDDASTKGRATRDVDASLKRPEENWRLIKRRITSARPVWWTLAASTSRCEGHRPLSYRRVVPMAEWFSESQRPFYSGAGQSITRRSNRRIALTRS